MQIDIRATDFLLTDGLRNYTERRVRAALSGRDDHIQQVIVRLSDIKRPSGSADKHCHIQVALACVTDVIIEDTESGWYAAIGCATERAGCTVERRLVRLPDKNGSYRKIQAVPHVIT